MNQMQRLTSFYAPLLGLALMVLLAACDQTAPTSSAPSATATTPETEWVQIAAEDGTVLGAVELPVGATYAEALRVTEQDGLRTMVFSDEALAARPTPRAAARGGNGPQNPTMVRGNYCYDVFLSFLDPPLFLGERCDHLTVVDTPGSGPQGHIASEFTSAFTGETTEGYVGPPGCIESFESGLVVVGTPIEEVELPFPPFTLYSTEARFYFPDGTVSMVGLGTPAGETCEGFRDFMEQVAEFSEGAEVTGRLRVIP